MGPLVVVDGSPVIDDRLGLEHGVERLDREDFVADAEPNDSTNGFCQGEPGSMKLRPLPPSRHRARTAFAVSRGRCPSARAPVRRRAHGRSGRAPAPRGRRRSSGQHRSPKASRVCSSTTWSSFNVRPSGHRKLDWLPVQVALTDAASLARHAGGINRDAPCGDGIVRLPQASSSKPDE